MRRTYGFTLIELMITIAIVAILAGVALPSYAEFVKRGRVSEVVGSLSGMRAKLEQFYQDNHVYTGACTVGTVAPLPADTDSFAYACNPAPAARTYTVTATGKGSLLGAVYTINEQGLHATVTPPPNWSNLGCGWVLRKDGSC